MGKQETTLVISAKDKTAAAVKSAKAQLNTLKNAAIGVSGALGMIGVGGGVAGIAAIGRQVSSLADEIDTLSKLSGLGAEEFQRYAGAAKTVGIEQDKLADIYKDTRDRIGDFLQTGGGPLLDFFEQIAPKVGVTAEQFRELSGKDGLQLIVDSLQKANISQNDFIFYMEAIASDSSKLIPLLRDQGKEFENISKNIDTISQQDIDRLNEANDRLLEFKNFAVKYWAEATAAALEYLGVFEKADSGDGLLGGLLAQMDALKTKGEALVLMGDAKEQIETITDRISYLKDEFDELSGKRGASFVKERNEILKSLESEEFALHRLFNFYGQLEGKILTLPDAVDTVAKSTNEAAESTGKWFSIAEKGAERLAGGIEDGLVNAAKQGKIAFGDLADFIISEILRIAIRQMVLAPLFGMLGGVFSGIGGSIFGGLGSGFSNAASNITGVPKAATGGSFVVSGQGGGGTDARLVSMALTPGEQVDVTPAGKRGMGKGDTYYIDARGADRTGLARLENMIRQTQASIQPIALSAVQNMRSRKPGFLSV